MNTVFIDDHEREIQLDNNRRQKLYEDFDKAIKTYSDCVLHLDIEGDEAADMLLMHIADILPPETSIDWLLRFLDGVADIARENGAYVLVEEPS